MTLRHYWSSDLDSVPRARAAVLPVCVSSLPFTVDNVSAQFLCVLHFSKNSFPMEDSRMSTSYFYLQAVEEKVGSEFSDRVLKQVFVGQTKEGWI